MNYRKLKESIENIAEYKAICNRIEKLLLIVDNETLIKDKNFIELNILSGLIVDYEDLGFSILMQQTNRKDTVSRSDIMEILDECKLNHIPNKETKKAIIEAGENRDLTPIGDLDKYLQSEIEEE